MGKYRISEFEEVVLLTIAVLYNEAYGVSIKQHIEASQDRKVSVGALQSCLQRLEKKGYLTSREGEANSIRGGRPKKYFELTAAGKKTLAVTRELRNQLWDAIPQAIMDVNLMPK